MNGAMPVPRTTSVSPRAPLACCALLAWLGLPACDSLGEFRTGSGEVFHGEVLGSTTDPVAASFIREGFVSHTEMDLTFDPALARSPASADDEQRREPAGTLDTYVCPPETDLCPKSQRAPGPFQRAALEPIERLNHDALSQYDFPGGGRLRNYILGAHFESETSAGGKVERHALVFLSLMENGQVEVRVLAGSMREPDGEDELPGLFGVFVLERRKP
jgi:hypothetical protein